MSYVISIDDDQLDEIIRTELEFQRECCAPDEEDLIEAFNKVIEVFTPASEIVAREFASQANEAVEDMYGYHEGVKQATYMYGNFKDLPVDQKITKVSYHFGV